MATPRTGASHAIAPARATAAAAITLAMLAVPTSPADAFVNPPAAFPCPSAWPRGTAATTTPASAASTPTATALFSGGPIARDASERERTGVAKSRSTAARERRHERLRSALGRPLHSSPPGAGDAGGAPGGGEGTGDENTGDPAAGGDGAPPDMSESEKLREKLETIAKTPAPDMDSGGSAGISGGLSKEEQEALEELQEDRRVEEELERLEAAQKAKSMDSYLFAEDEEEEDPDAEVRAVR